MFNKKWQECLKLFSNTYIRFLLVAVFFTGFGFIVSSLYVSSQFQVIYSLDKKSNDKEIVKVIDDADRYVYFAIYYFSKQNIADALIRAKKRGVKVIGISDRQASTENNKNVIEKLQINGVDIRISNNTNGLMHIKALVTEKSYASGSYNWTSSATNSNDEILEIGNDNGVRKQYQKILEKLIDKNPPKEFMLSTSTPAISKVSEILNIEEAKNHIGQYATVQGEVKKVYTAKSGVTFIDFCTNYKKCPFTAVVFASNRALFKDLDKVKGKVSVYGQIKEYDGRAEIILEEPQQLTVSKD